MRQVCIEDGKVVELPSVRRTADSVQAEWQKVNGESIRAALLAAEQLETLRAAVRELLREFDSDPYVYAESARVRALRSLTEK